MLVQTGCSSDSTTDDVDPIVIRIEVSSPQEGDSIATETSFTIQGQLTGYTSNYSQINFYLGDNPSPINESLDNATLRTLEETQPLDAEFIQVISTVGFMAGSRDLKVEALGSNGITDEVIIPIEFVLPDSTRPWIDLEIINPNTTEFDIGDIIEFAVDIQGNNTMFISFDAYLGNSTTPFETFTTYDTILNFNFDTVDLSVGNHSMRFQVTDINGDIKERIFSFKLFEFIPTFEITDDGGIGYELKSIVQTYDGGYITVASSEALGTRLVKYDYNKETETPYQVWEKNISANIGVAESICEDREYDGGIVIAGWRDNGSDKDTWIRKIDSDDGSLLWNKHFGYLGIDDGATVIKKSIDDGYIVGGYTENYYRSEDGGYTEFIIPGRSDVGADSVTYNWDTGYDIRLLKVYSNGNENWGYNNTYKSHNAWHDITGHTIWWETHIVAWWVRTMGDQYITDLVVNDDGTFYVTGWNNSRLYDGSEDKDMFYAQFDNLGGYISTMSWSKMGCYDVDHIEKDIDDFWIYFDIPGVQNRLGDYTLGANHLGTFTENEIGYSITGSYGGYGGDVVMVGETNEIDDTPAKSKLNDGWVVEFKINGDDDGAMWEYTFGEAEVEDKAYGIDQTKDNGYIITGYTTGTDKQTWTYKLNKEQLIVWSHKYDTTGDDWGVKALQCRDGGYMTGGNVGTGTGVRARLIKVNKLGELEE